MNSIHVLAYLLTALAVSSTASYCSSCNVSQLWLDVILLLDGSTTLDQTQFNKMTSDLKIAFRQITIGQEDRFQTRVGVIVYGETVKEAANLTDFTTQDDFQSLKISYIGDETGNLAGAIDVARDQFYACEVNRANRKSIIVIVSGGYRAGHFSDPTATAQTFKDTGGIIITAFLAHESQHNSSLLRTITSPGYFLEANNGIYANELTTFLCKANCFCPCTSPCTAVSDHWTAPVGNPEFGCYQFVTLESVQELTIPYCASGFNGSLVMPVDVPEVRYTLLGYTDQQQREGVWIGMKNNGTAAAADWRWLDGTPVSATIQQNILPGDGPCAYLKSGPGFHYSFVPADCLATKLYACQAAPCSSTNFCVN